jgi:anti-sigma factor RsiW
VSPDSTTTCAELRPLLRDAGRGRLDPERAALVSAHLATCAACRAVSEEEHALDQLLEERLPQRPASLGLKRRLEARLPPLAPAAPRSSAGRTRRAALIALPLAACAALVLVLRPRLEPKDPLIAEAIADHLRVVYREQPVDVESGGPHRVKPWFTGRLDFAIPQVYGGDQEFILVGGAVALFQDRKAALLVYKRQLHTISLLVFPSEGLTLPSDLSVRQSRGFSVIAWRQGDLGYALTSDLNGGDLLTLARRISDQR